MKIVLLRDVAKIGRRHSIVEVPDGYALNSLIPKKDALPATPANVKRVQAMQSMQQSSKEDEVVLLEQMSKQVSSEPLVIVMEANEKGHLFQAVRAADVVKVAAVRGMKITTTQVVVEQVIKECGAHTVALKAHGKTFPLPIIVQAK